MRRLVLAFAAALFWTGSAADAQIPTSTRDRITSPRRNPGDAARTDPLFRRAIACTAELQPGRTRNLLNTIPGTPAERSIITSFQSRLNQCYNRLEGGLGFSWDLLRGGFAEVYYHRTFPEGLPGEPAPSTDRAAAWARPRTDDGRAPQLELLHAMARCVLLRRPAQVTQMLAAAPFSADEMRVIRAMQPDLSACLNAGVEFTASRQSLRGLLAEAALHYGEALRGGFAQEPATPPAR